MAARKRKILHDEETRSRIQATQIVNRFMACLNGEVTLDPQQVSVGKALLNKVLPDLSSVALGQDDELGALQVTIATGVPRADD